MFFKEKIPALDKLHLGRISLGQEFNVNESTLVLMVHRNVTGTLTGTESCVFFRSSDSVFTNSVFVMT